MRNRKYLAFFTSVLLVGCTTPGVETPDVLRPAFSAQKGVGGDKHFACFDSSISPYTENLILTSKYKGSDKSRSTLNKKAKREYKKQTEKIKALEKRVAKISSSFTRNQYQPDSIAQCFIQTLYPWAEQQALLSLEINHTGAAVRKWALAAIASNTNIISSTLDKQDPKVVAIFGWIEQLTDLSIKEWSDRPLEKVNNHDYWAAWAVMSSAVLLNNRDYWNWSVSKYQEAMSQIDSEGYLPNELKRKPRALAYHNYAVTPLVFMHAVMLANAQEVESERLQRLVNRVIVGLDNPEIFYKKTGEQQILKGVLSSYGLAWVPVWNKFTRGEKGSTGNAQILNQWEENYAPFSASRLGGNISAQWAE